MKTGQILLLLMVPAISWCCCVKKRSPRKTVLPQNTTQLYYRAVEGEVFWLPCGNGKVTWFRTGGNPDGHEDFSFECEKNFPPEVQHSGNYTEQSGRLFLYLQVVSQASLPCRDPKESHVTLWLNIRGKIFCPGVNCSVKSKVTWYKENTPASQEKRDSCWENGFLMLCTVSPHDAVLFFCDRPVMEDQVRWTYRRPVHVSVIPQDRASEPPQILYRKTTEEVEIGRPHSLVCEVHYPFEANFSPKVHWFVNPGGDSENHMQLQVDEPEQERVKIDRYLVTATTQIDKLTAQHLNNTYTCVASNKAGSSNVSVSLRRKITEEHVSLVGYPFAFLVLVTVLGVVLRRNRFELQLLIRSYCQYGKQHGDLEYDVFLSYVSSSHSTKFSTDLKAERAFICEEPLEFVLSRMLEDGWGYRVCMMERDLLPGGVFRDDVVSVIQRSRTVVCVLSPEYLSDTNAVFVLESGVEALLQASIQKLLLVQTSPATSRTAQVDSPLVHRAMKVLPRLVWTAGEADSSFWRSLRQTLPPQRVEMKSEKP